MTFASHLVLAKSHFYDDADRLVRTVYPSGTAILYTYDSADNVMSVSPTTVPVAPRSLQSVLTSTTAAHLTWEDASDNETGFRIERRLARGYEWEVIVTLPPNMTKYTDTTIYPDATYVYRIYAIDDSGATLTTSAYSSEVAAAGADSEAFTIRSFQISNDRVEILLEADPLYSYVLQTSHTLHPDSWQITNFSLLPDGPEVLSSLSGINGSIVLYIDFPESEKKFYRLTRQ
jgi:YD repeat-containing protein